MRILCHLPLLAAFSLLLAAAAAAREAGPRVPCTAGGTPYPAYAAAGTAPAVEIWRDIELDGDQDCLGRLQGRMVLVAALSARFRHAGTLDDLAGRAGAISETVGLKYWSTTEQSWRTLISGATALTGPGGDWRDGDQWRADFSAAEIRSGETLWFRQNDTRSTGENLYRLRALQSGPDRLVVEIVNESPITFTFVTLFGAHELLSLHVVERLEGDLWGYYSLAAVREEPVEDYAKSLVNRAAAFFRFLRGQPGDAAPPLAK
jgi:hypothetical protein